MTLPKNPGDLFPTEYTAFLLDYIVKNFEELREEYGDSPRKILNHADLKEFRFNGIPDLINRYICEGKLSAKHELGLIAQISSPDVENWLVCLLILQKI